MNNIEESSIISIQKSEIENTYSYIGKLPSSNNSNSQPITLIIRKIHSKGINPTYTMIITIDQKTLNINSDNYFVIENLIQFFKNPTF